MRIGARIALALTTTCAVLVVVAPATGATRAPGRIDYVALGDSYTSGPLILNQHGSPIDCGRSDHDYPSLVAAALAAVTFTDVSCASAETKHMTAPQTGLPLGGTNPPQFDALSPGATLVTVGIGGNDAGLVGVAVTCAELGLTRPTGTACRDHYAPGGHDAVTARIAATKPKIAAVLQGIHLRSPQARVAIVGYPDVLPTNGGSCYPMVPLSPDDVRYLDEKIRAINTMIAGQAAANDAEFVDTYADSVGHDVCTLPPTRWFEGLVPTEPAFPLHPNAQGEASMARSAIAVLSRPRPVAADVPAAPILSRARVSRLHPRAGSAVLVRYRLDRAASVIATVRRSIAGRRSGARCAPATRANRRARRCTRSSRVLLTARDAGMAGANRLRLSTRSLGRSAARYRVTLVATADGLRSARAATSFRIVRR